MSIAPAISWQREVEDYLARSYVKPGTARRYREMLFRVGSIGGWGSSRRVQLQTLAKSLVAQPWRPSYRNLVAGVALRFLQANGVGTNPLDRVGFCRAVMTPQTAIRSEVQIISPQRFRAILLAANKKSLRLAGLLSCYWDTGCRVREALNLRWEDIDFDRKMVRIAARISNPATGVWAWTPKTAHGERVVPVSNGFLKLMSELKAIKRPQPYCFIAYRQFNEIRRKPDCIPSVDDLWPRLRGVVSSVCLLARTPEIQLKDFRHTRITAWAMQTNPVIPLKAVQMLAGHASPNVTLRYYTHMTDDQVCDFGRTGLDPEKEDIHATA